MKKSTKYIIAVVLTIGIIALIMWLRKKYSTSSTTATKKFGGLTQRVAPIVPQNNIVPQMQKTTNTGTGYTVNTNQKVSGGGVGYHK